MSCSLAGAVAVACCVVASIAATARAASGESFALSWSAPAECPSEAEVEGFVARDLGAIARGRTVVRASGVVSVRSDGRYGVELELDTGAAASSRRELSGVSCDEVSEAAALVVALTIRAEAEPAARPEPEQPKEPQRPTVNRHERPYMAAALALDVGSLPKPTVGLALAGGMTFAWLRVEPALAIYAPGSGDIAGTGEGARFLIGSGQLRACVPFPSSAVWLAPCLGGGVDWVHASGFGADETRSTSTFDAFGTGALLGGWDISPIISARVDVGVVAPLARPTFVVDGEGQVYHRGSVALRSQLGLELHF